MNSDIPDGDCVFVLRTILSKNHHSSPLKAIDFLLDMSKFDPFTVDNDMRIAADYYFQMKNYHASTAGGKRFIYHSCVRYFEISSLSCCYSLLDPDKTSSVVRHSFSIDHFIHKNGFDDKPHSLETIRYFYNYYIETNNTNQPELKSVFGFFAKAVQFVPLLEKVKRQLQSAS
jgi:hypothetical protein